MSLAVKPFLSGCAAALLVPATLAIGATAAPGPCGVQKMREILEVPGRDNRRVVIDCDVRLQRGQVITKQLVFVGARSSGVTFKCDGGQVGKRGQRFTRRRAIVIRSQRRGGGAQHTAWSAPERIRIDGCQIYGSIIAFGMGQSGKNKALRRSSLRPGHIDRARRAAPRDITLNRLRIMTTGGAALYLSPGVTRVTLENSILAGKSKSVTVYLAPETARNVIRNNRFTKENRREQLAIDGSQHNLVERNWFGSLSTGGIYLYRNCGEDGMIRHSPPQHNRIVGNVFFYKWYWGWNPAIWLASRGGNRSYCGRDKGYDFGSSASDRDFARHNEITGNLFVDRAPQSYIRRDDTPNTIKGNRKVSAVEAKVWLRQR